MFFHLRFWNSALQNENIEGLSKPWPPPFFLVALLILPRASANELAGFCHMIISSSGVTKNNHKQAYLDFG